MTSNDGKTGDGTGMTPLKRDHRGVEYLDLADIRREESERRAALLAAEQERRAREQEEWDRKYAENQARVVRNNLAKDLGARYSPERASLGTYEVYHVAQRAVLDRLKGIADRLKDFTAEGRGLLFLGTVGTGKDHLLAAMLYEAVGRGLTCQWVNGQAFYGRLRDAMRRDGREWEVLGPLASPQVLAISDPLPPLGGLSEFNAAQLYRLVDDRYRAGKPTWLSINAEDLRDADERLTGPVWDRLQEKAEVFVCRWGSYRERVRVA